MQEKRHQAESSTTVKLFDLLNNRTSSEAQPYITPTGLFNVTKYLQENDGCNANNGTYTDCVFPEYDSDIFPVVNFTYLDAQHLLFSNPIKCNSTYPNESCNFSYSRLSYSNFEDTNIQSIIGLHSDLYRVYFLNTYLADINLGFSNLDETNFYNSTLKGIFFSLSNCSGSNFYHTNTTDASFCENMSNTSFTHSSIINGEFNNVNMPNTNFSHSIIVGGDFNNVNMPNADFSYSSIVSSSFYDGNMPNASFFRSTIDGVEYLYDLQMPNGNFSQSFINNTIFRGTYGHLHLPNTDFSRTVINGSFFQSASMPYCNFDYSTINHSYFDNVGRPLIMGGASFLETFINKTRFWLSDMPNSNFFKAKITYSEFYGTNMPGTNFSNSTLVATNFRKTNLWDCDLSSAQTSGGFHLDGSDMSRCNLQRMEIGNQHCLGDQLTAQGTNLMDANLCDVSSISENPTNECPIVVYNSPGEIKTMFKDSGANITRTQFDCSNDKSFFTPSVIAFLAVGAATAVSLLLMGGVAYFKRDTIKKYAQDSQLRRYIDRLQRRLFIKVAGAQARYANRLVKEDKDFEQTESTVTEKFTPERIGELLKLAESKKSLRHQEILGEGTTVVTEEFIGAVSTELSKLLPEQYEVAVEDQMDEAMKKLVALDSMIDEEGQESEELEKPKSQHPSSVGSKLLSWIGWGKTSHQEIKREDIEMKVVSDPKGKRKIKNEQEVLLNDEEPQKEYETLTKQ